MKKYIYICMVISFVTALSSVSVMAQQSEGVPGVTVENQSLTRNADAMAVSMDLDLSALKVKSNGAAVFVPMIVNGVSQKELPAVGIYGRNNWFQGLRAGAKPLGGVGEDSYRYSKRPSVLEYRESVPYEEWMNGAELILCRYDYGCCSKQTAAYSTVLGKYGEEKVELPAYAPEFIYVRPVAETVKTRALSGRAFIDFAANATELQPDYRNNRAELTKITATIDSVRNDGDISVTSVVIKGSASPEGPYTTNEKLAKGRTEALKNYVSKLYRFNSDFIKTDYVAENWEGLREYVAGSSLAHKSEILAIIDDSSLKPDTKDWRIKLNYPEEYKKLASEVFPTLRRSDYRIEYSVRSYDDIETMRRIMAESPQKLSLSELFALAQSYEQGSAEYNNVIETAARLYPNDATANLNAANAAMSRKDFSSAEAYLSKAGTSGEAVYARGVLAGLQGDKERAESLIRQAGAMGVGNTSAAVEHLLNSEAK